MFHRVCFRVGVAAIVLFIAIAVDDLTAQQAPRLDDDPRVTPTVKLVRKCLPAIVSVRVERPTNNQQVAEHGHGGGSVIHADGYILTNNHVVAGARKIEVAFFQGEWRQVRLIARLPSDDLALLKIDSDEPLAALRLGRSDDLELGEPVITIGSPGALPHSLSTGLISGLGRATNTEHAHLPSMVQTSAPISGGSSGGALINALGEQIGVITSRKTDGENLGFAITVDRVREVFPHLVGLKDRFGIVHGVSVDMLEEGAVLKNAMADSPATQAGLQTGDVIKAIDGKSLINGVDFHLAFIDRKPGDTLGLDIHRGEEQLKLSLQLGEAKTIQPVEVDGLKPGLRVARYSGQWRRLPEFDKLTPDETSSTDKSPRTLKDPAENFFGQRFSGYVKIPEDGVYYLITRSDDGSRLWLGEELIVDNDGWHAEQEVASLIRLRHGLYPLRVDFFEAAGDQILKVLIESPTGVRRELPADWLFHVP